MKGHFTGTRYKDIASPKYRYLGQDARAIQRACNRVLEDIRKHPPHVLGWLRGGVDSDRMKRMKEDIENGSAV